MVDSDAATHYSGASGEEYFRYQRAIGLLGARLDRPKFVEHVTDSDVVLDFGCGGGYLLAELPAARRIGVEPNLPAQATARELGLEVFPSLHGIEDGSIDVVISNHALEHTRRPFDDLVEIQRVLRRGGKLVLWLPLDDWRSGRDISADENHHLYTWTPRLLAALLREAGFEVSECAVVAHAWSLRYSRLHERLPAPAFDLLCRVTAMVLRRRQLQAVAHAA